MLSGSVTNVWTFLFSRSRSRFQFIEKPIGYDPSVLTNQGTADRVSRPKMSSAQLRYANQLEIVRSEEKDRYMISQLSRQLDELYTKLFGLNHFHVYQPYLHRLSEFLYYLTTTLSNRQTIGEEYVCLIQYDRDRKKIPQLSRRLLMVAIRVFGDLISKYVLSSCLIRPLAEEYLHPKLSPQTIELISRFFLTFIERTHRIVFYLTGSYYNLSKTLTQIRYLIYTRSSSDSDNIQAKLNHTMKLLSLCLVIQHLVESYSALKQISLSITQHRQELERQANEQPEQKIVSDEPNPTVEHVRCPLCYELAISNVALVPECGHVFCWQCIHTWVADNQTCPLCKTSTNQSRIVHLINY